MTLKIHEMELPSALGSARDLPTVPERAEGRIVEQVGRGSRNPYKRKKPEVTGE